MSSDVTSETLTVNKSELQLWIREAVRVTLHEELQLWRNTTREWLNTKLEESAIQPYTLGEILDTEFFGMWCDRNDLPASPALARTLRAQAWERAA